MVKEYIEKKLKEAQELLNKKIIEKNELNERRTFLKNSISQMQENSNLDFEIFSPRKANTSHSTKGQLNTLYSEMNEIKRKITLLNHEIEDLEKEVSDFNVMMKEIECFT